MAGEVIVARERNADSVNYKTGRLVMNVIQRNDISTQQKNRYLRMIRRAGRNMLGLENE